MNETRRGPGVIGTIRRLDERRGAVRMEDVYDTGIEDLWSAITEPVRLARWIAEVEGDLRVGGLIRARFTSAWTGPGRIDVCDPPHRLLVTLDPGSDEESTVEAVLTAEGDRTRLVVEDRGLPMPELAAHGAGWQVHVEDLAAHLTGVDAAGWRERWIALTPDYEKLAEDLR